MGFLCSELNATCELRYWPGLYIVLYYGPHGLFNHCTINKLQFLIEGSLNIPIKLF